MNAPTTQAERWLAVEQAFSLHLYEPDTEALRIVYSAVAAQYLPGSAVWLFDVAPPSSGKTIKLYPLEKAVGAHILSSVTPRTFLSGYANDDKSLLTKIKNGVLVIKDFSQILAMGKNDKAAVLADFRDIFDGFANKEYGTGENRRWEGRITLIAAATPDLDNHYSVFQSLGERFIQVRSRRPGGVKAAMAAINGEGEKGKQAIAAAVIDLFRNINKLQPVQPQLSDPQIHCIANLAEFCVRARTHVPRNGSNKEIVYMPEPEASPRLGQQFAQLARGSALLDGRSSVNSTDLALVNRVAFDSVRKDRRDILETLWRGHKAVSGSDLARIIRLPQSTVSRRLEELRGMELVDVIEDDGVVGGLAKLSDLAISFL